MKTLIVVEMIGLHPMSCAPSAGKGRILPKKPILASPIIRLLRKYPCLYTSEEADLGVADNKASS
jgi:hypothetical protein